jgi:hypothetical protein
MLHPAMPRATNSARSVRRSGCLLLVVTLLATGCSATRPQVGQTAHVADLHRTEACSSARDDVPALSADEGDGTATALRVATTVLIASAIAAGVLLGAHGGALTPPLQLDAMPACASSERDHACAAAGPPCDVATAQAPS